MKYLYLMALVCFALVGCGHNPAVVTKTEVQYVKPPLEMRQSCEYIAFDIERDTYLDMDSVDKELYLFGLVKESILKTRVCNKMIESLNTWIEGVK